MLLPGHPRREEEAHAKTPNRVGASHPGIPLGVIAVIMFLCAGFLKLMEKCQDPLRHVRRCSASTSGSRASSGRAVVWTIIALAIGIYVAVMHKKIAKGPLHLRGEHGASMRPGVGWMAASAVLVFVLIGVARRRKHWRVKTSMGAWRLARVHDVQLGIPRRLVPRHVDTDRHLEVDVVLPS